MNQVIRKHFKKYLRRKPWDFCWRIGVESFVVSIIAALLLHFVGTAEREFPDLPMFVLIVLAVLVAPPVETLIMQAFPIFITRLLKGSFNVQIIVGTIIFSLFHIPEGFATFIAAGIIGGFYFSFAYARWRRKSRWKAFWVTALGHSIHNAIVFALVLIAELAQ